MVFVYYYCLMVALEINRMIWIVALGLVNFVNDVVVTVLDDWVVALMGMLMEVDVEINDVNEHLIDCRYYFYYYYYSQMKYQLLMTMILPAVVVVVGAAAWILIQVVFHCCCYRCC